MGNINLNVLKEKQIAKFKIHLDSNSAERTWWQRVTKKHYKQKGKHKSQPKEVLDETTLANKYTCMQTRPKQ